MYQLFIDFGCSPKDGSVAEHGLCMQTSPRFNLQWHLQLQGSQVPGQGKSSAEDLKVLLPVRTDNAGSG